MGVQLNPSNPDTLGKKLKVCLWRDFHVVVTCTQGPDQMFGLDRIQGLHGFYYNCKMVSCRKFNFKYTTNVPVKQAFKLENWKVVNEKQWIIVLLLLHRLPYISELLFILLMLRIVNKIIILPFLWIYSTGKSP